MSARNMKMKKLRNWYAKNLKTTWYIEKWDNVDQADSGQEGYDINNPPFYGTKLIKGLFGKKLFSSGRSWSVHMVVGDDEYKPSSNMPEYLQHYLQYRAQRNAIIFGANTSKGVHTTKLPYHRREPWKNRSIMLHLDRKALEELCKSGVKKFKCTYNYYYGL